MIIKFSSVSPFIESVLTHLKNGKLISDPKISIIITSKPNNLLDLFALGRLLAFIYELQHSFNIEIEFIFPPHKNLENLNSLGFFEYCKANNLKYKLTPEAQLDLFERPKLEPSHQNVPLTRKNYWQCLLPLCRHRFRKVDDEHQIVSLVNQHTDLFASQIFGTLEAFGVDPRDATPELSRILLSMVRELLSNTISHSNTYDFLFAVTLSRETWTGTRPHRPGIIFPSGQDKYEVLLMDFGQGIYPSVLQTLSQERSRPINSGYFQPVTWHDSYRLDKAKEESLLTNIFRGDLVIRKGRKSEGLYELGQSLSWFGGMLSLFTGRTEMQISASESEELSAIPRFVKRPYYLPGVIASLALPAQQVKTASIKSFAQVNSLVPSNNKYIKACKIHRFENIPSGFFGGVSIGKIRRRSELDAEFIITEYEKIKYKDNYEPFFWDINLRMSDNIDMDFIDNFIQELCKRIDQVEPAHPNNFFKLIFTNVPRNIIHALEKRNCKSFLMLKNTFCLFLDEADEPYFLGVPRASKNIFDIEDALKLILHSGLISRKDLVSKLGMAEYAIDHLERLLQDNRNSIFSCKQDEGDLVFECYDILGALAEARYDIFRSLERVRLRESQGAIFKLRNGAYVDCIFDFCLLWSDNDTLIDCAKLLLNQSGFPLVDTLLCFMNNGDRLASAIQRITKTPNLIIVDPHNKDEWGDIELSGNCVLIVDALYPGDDQAGYIKEFIELMGGTNKDIEIKWLYAFCDFRSNAASSPRLLKQGKRTKGSRSLIGVSAISVPIPQDFTVPHATQPSADDNILKNYLNYVLSKPTQSRLTIESADNSSGYPWKAYQYSPIELSTEFWQNVSALKIVTSHRSGREKRNVLFYEHNEKLIQNPRMLRVVTEFVAEFVKNTLNSKVDVILHPSHSVGSFLAQVVSAQLNTPPLVFPLSQRSYGGSIELTSGDYQYYRTVIEDYKTKHKRSNITCLIVDDSILTGNSVFTMLGIAARLGLVRSGILVLLSRLTPEISSAISGISIPFSYLYRLHMPILTDKQSPDTKLKLINQEIQEASSSYFAHLRASQLEIEDSHFRIFKLDIDDRKPPAVKDRALEDIQGEYIETYRLKQIIINLILHPDSQILSFDTRVAIAYNFLEQLVLEEGFWKLLQSLFTTNDPPNSYSQSILFIQKIIYILAFSKHILPYSVYEKYQKTCCEFVKMSFENQTWVELKDLITDCIMALGIILSEKLMQVGSLALGPVLEFALEECSENIGKVSSPNGAHATPSATDRKEAARDIIGAFAWSLHYYISKKGHTVIDSRSANAFVDAVTTRQLNTEVNLILIDILEPVITTSLELREKLGIAEWHDEQIFITALTESGTSNRMLNYLKEAPGYTCTLKTLLRTCKADTVLLYAKNESDQQYILRVFDTRDNKKPDKDLKADNLGESYLPSMLRERMEKSLFFSSSHPDYVKVLNDFSIGSEHLWCMGGAVHLKNDNMRYYVILGYKKRPATRSLQSTAYYYWLKCETLLREVLPSVHSRYIESATAWNVHIQSIRPIHPITWEDTTRSPLVNARRQIISYAMTKVDIGELLRRAVRMSSEPVYTLLAIQAEIEKECKRLHINISSLIDQNPKLAESALWQGIDMFPFINVEADALASEQSVTFCALPMTLLKFITYECLYNALSYFESKIQVRVNFEPFVDSESIVEKLWIILTVSNDIHLMTKGLTSSTTQIGTSACETAAAAVGGYFHAGKNEQNGMWEATTKLPGFKVPDELRMRLYDLLK